MGCPKMTYFTTVPRLYNAAKRGNILSKTDAGTLQYDEPSHPYQVTGQTDFSSKKNNGVPTTAKVGTPLTLTGTVVLADATYQTIVWSVQDARTAGIYFKRTERRKR